MNIILLGPQGSGKGTQAKMLAEKLGLTIVETGKILREIAETDHPWGRRIKDMQMRGVLVSDDILMAVLKETLSKPARRGYLFDGTPRNIVQYKLIKEVLEDRGEKIDKVVVLNISEEETIKRLSSRRTCLKCGRVYNLITSPPPEENKCECGGELSQRDDDFPEAIKKRLDAYKKSTSKVIEKAKNENVLIEIDGERAIDVIHEDIISKLEDRSSK
ncbi:MAG: Adenylate kinase [Candidatus Amesbacteria bacterium GW2011_GWC1_47_15]|uniref:Adenylate kinase n=2 Tax=Candidatus Amesiibacteriota TaxID=1752730 RepID=A0A1F4ZV06_9BACT|nr:MAG: Adenylate kinase [Candidatus Amesbacteria bacterium GW2011_GWC1_47_15]OGD10171.1 MAG: hypothetical protein A2395_02130 [Candidatus Amesbacteria bacterium RIFOXYB1_FULL_47_9]